GEKPGAVMLGAPCAKNPSGSPRSAHAAVRLQHAGAVALRVEKGNVLPNAGYLDRFSEHFATRFSNASYGRLNVVHRNDDGRVLRRPIGLFREETAIDGTGRSAGLGVRLGGG